MLAFSGDEPLHAELQQDGVIARLEQWPNVELESLPGRDHTLRPINAQRAVHDFLDRQLASEIARPAIAPLQSPRATACPLQPAPCR